MTRKRRHRMALAALAALLIGLAACGRTASTRFYTLSPISEGDPAASEIEPLRGTAVGIGPVNLPDYLDRPQIVIRESLNELRLAEFDKWAGSLKYAVPRVIADNLSVLLGSDQIFTFPWKSALPIRYQVTIDILRFDAEMGSHADLEAQWSIFEDDGRILRITRKSKLRRPVKPADYAAVVRAESLALSELSREIAAALLEISSP